ncbi:MAG: DUF4115 domain-containing protein [Armatimonadota bacterium]|nr:DUF4115 domain-containing protein [Armatimonadota bacterium]
MGSIGQTLRQHRENLGISLAEVHSATRITPQNLEALEEERFDIFPNKVYTRAFLRDYANFLGLDSGVLLEQYELHLSPNHREAPAIAASKPSDGATTVVRAFAILIILVVVGLAAYKPLARSIRGLANRDRAPVVADNDDSAPIPPPKPIPVTTPTPKPTPAPQPPDGVNFVVDVVSTSWIRVTVDGKRAFEGMLGPPHQLSWRAERAVVFRAGNAGGVRLTVNGRKLPPLGNIGQIVERRFAVPTTPAAPPNAVTPQPPY